MNEHLVLNLEVEGLIKSY